eukprot:s4658_g2.t1
MVLTMLHKIEEPITVFGSLCGQQEVEAEGVQVEASDYAFKAGPMVPPEFQEGTKPEELFQFHPGGRLSADDARGVEWIFDNKDTLVANGNVISQCSSLAMLRACAELYKEEQMHKARAPSKEKRLLHEMTHLPYRSWCDFCDLLAKLKQIANVGRMILQKDDAVCLPSRLTAYGKIEANKPTETVLIGINTGSKMLTAYPVETKGTDLRGQAEHLVRFSLMLNYFGQVEFVGAEEEPFTPKKTLRFDDAQDLGRERSEAASSQTFPAGSAMVDDSAVEEPQPKIPRTSPSVSPTSGNLYPPSFAGNVLHDQEEEMVDDGPWGQKVFEVMEDDEDLQQFEDEEPQDEVHPPTLSSEELEEVDRLAGFEEISRLLDMGVLKDPSPEECEKGVPLSTRSVYDWRHRGGEWKRRCRFVAREFRGYAKTTAETFAPTSGVLNRVLPGQRNGAARFFNLLAEHLETLDFENTALLPSLFRHRTRQVVLCSYVDDLVLCGERGDLQWLIGEIEKKFIISGGEVVPGPEQDPNEAVHFLKKRHYFTQHGVAGVRHVILYLAGTKTYAMLLPYKVFGSKMDAIDGRDGQAEPCENVISYDFPEWSSCGILA